MAAVRAEHAREVGEWRAKLGDASDALSRARSEAEAERKQVAEVSASSGSTGGRSGSRGRAISAVVSM